MPYVIKQMNVAGTWCVLLGRGVWGYERDIDKAEVFASKADVDTAIDDEWHVGFLRPGPASERRLRIVPVRQYTETVEVQRVEELA